MGEEPLLFKDEMCILQFVNVLKHIHSNLFPQMEPTGHQQYEKKKGKNTLQLRPVQFLITQHKDIRMLKENQAKQSLQNDKKTVYMFSNIFVLYYIQLSLLKMEYRWLLYCRTENTNKKEAKCSMSPAGLWHAVQRLSWLWSERKAVDWCCLKGVLFPMSYSSFPPALEQGFFPEHTDAHSPCTT